MQPTRPLTRLLACLLTGLFTTALALPAAAQENDARIPPLKP